MKINVHGGHNSIVPGAKGYLDELREDRKVTRYFSDLMKSAGHKVRNCTDNKGITANQILVNVVKKHNKDVANLGVSFHLNASTGRGHGCEVYYYDDRTKPLAAAISKAVSNALGIADRGPKEGKHLYVVRNTIEPLVLVECCFVDNAEDAKQWNPAKCAKAVANAINKYYGFKPVNGDDVKKPIKSAIKPQKEPKPIKPGKSITAVARDVVKGKYGNGEQRRSNLIAAGYNPDKVQKAVNKILRG